MRSTRTWLAALTLTLLVPLATLSQQGEERDVNPGREAAQCIMNLKRIHRAIEAYRRQHKSLPNWLSDLELNDRFLHCPVHQRTGEAPPQPFKDPNSDTTYSYQFCNVPVPANIWGGSSHTMREWKQRQMGLVGGSVPIVRCRHHTPILNLAFDGTIYASPGAWEILHRDVVRMRDLSPAVLFGEAEASPARTVFEPAPAQDLEQVQGRWERSLTDDDGKTIGTVIKEIDGSSETVTYIRNEEVQRQHTVDIELRRRGDLRFFSFRNMKVTEGPDKGETWPPERRGGYMYRIEENGNAFIEVRRTGPEGQQRTELRWKKTSSER